MTRVDIKPSMLRWARERAGMDLDVLTARFPKLMAWEERLAQPTLKQLEAFAHATHVPVGYLFLEEPPEEQVPIPDFRTFGSKQVSRPSPDLLETIYLCQQRQEWYHNFARGIREDKIRFVGSMTTDSDIIDAAASIRSALSFDLEDRRRCPTWTEALRRFMEQADSVGVLVMVNGVVGNNNYRKLDPFEFRGFALADDWAPLVFINGSDSKAGQMFTLAHELAHLWLGQSALSNIELVSKPKDKIESWCNKVAAETLVPISVFKAEYIPNNDLRKSLDHFARRFKVSTLVILRRIYDVRGLTEDGFWAAYQAELNRIQSLQQGSGGNFYLTQSARIGKRFARALISNTLEGQTLHRDAFHLLGFSKLSTMRDLAQSLGVV